MQRKNIEACLEILGLNVSIESLTEAQLRDAYKAKKEKIQKTFSTDPVKLNEMLSKIGHARLELLSTLEENNNNIPDPTAKPNKNKIKPIDNNANNNYEETERNKLDKVKENLSRAAFSLNILLKSFVSPVQLKLNKEFHLAVFHILEPSTDIPFWSIQLVVPNGDSNDADAYKHVVKNLSQKMHVEISKKNNHDVLIISEQDVSWSADPKFISDILNTKQANIINFRNYIQQKANYKKAHVMNNEICIPCSAAYIDQAVQEFLKSKNILFDTISLDDKIVITLSYPHIANAVLTQSALQEMKDIISNLEINKNEVRNKNNNATNVKPNEMKMDKPNVNTNKIFSEPTNLGPSLQTVLDNFPHGFSKSLLEKLPKEFVNWTPDQRYALLCQTNNTALRHSIRDIFYKDEDSKALGKKFLMAALGYRKDLLKNLESTQNSLGLFLVEAEKQQYTKR